MPGAKELAPSDELRTGFDHDPGTWAEFRRRHFAGLGDRSAEVGALRERLCEGPVTPACGARDGNHDNAAALKADLDRQERR